MSKFKISTKKEADPAALAAFAAGAETHEPLAQPDKVLTTAAPITPKTDKKTESLLFRLTPTDLQQFNYVFENTNVKSKQLLLESLILPELARRASELKSRN
jgi:type II secretory pathway component GspD/PulD (secretin)